MNHSTLGFRVIKPYAMVYGGLGVYGGGVRGGRPDVDSERERERKPQSERARERA